MKKILLNAKDQVLSRDEMKAIKGGWNYFDQGNPTCGIDCRSGCRPSSDGCPKCNYDTGRCTSL